MQISPNAVDTITPIAFIEHSNSLNNFVGGFVVNVISGGLTRVVSQTPTPSVKELMIAINAGFAPATLTLRKYFAAGQEFVDETFAIAATGNFNFKSTTLLETCEVYLTSTSAIAGPLPCKVTIIGRS